jgi:CheY-like chemotaxis protein
VQGVPALDRAQGGLGIGLSLVRRLMELHGGSIGAQSEGEGRGSTFTARFRRVDKPVAPVPEPATTGAPAGVQRVLVVDDHADSRETLCELLILSGWECVQAADGIEGVRLALASPPDLAIIDIGLPGLDGYEVATRLRAEPATRGIRMIALTGYGQEQDRQRALKSGFDAHLVKPASVEKLMQTLATLFGP